MRLLDAKTALQQCCDLGICVISVTHVARKTREREMNYLSDVVVNQRPMLQVAGEIILAFCCATPLVLLLCFLV
jgi:hypothetical protein